jgi:hypothetical protein
LEAFLPLLAELLTKLSIERPTFDLQDEVVQDNATANKHDGPAVAAL